MGRFWFKHEDARRRIVAALEQEPNGRIVPSHMGLKPITGMHGYHPDDPDSDAALLSNVPPPGDPQAITDVFHVMKSEAGLGG